MDLTTALNEDPVPVDQQLLVHYEMTSTRDLIVPPTISMEQFLRKVFIGYGLLADIKIIDAITHADGRHQGSAIFTFLRPSAAQNLLQLYAQYQQYQHNNTSSFPSSDSFLKLFERNDGLILHIAPLSLSN